MDTKTPFNVFVAGGSGTIGRPLVRALRSAGHQVTVMTRSAAKQDELRAAGVSVVVADALDREAVTAAVRESRPTHVIHQLTAIPQDGARRASDLDATNRLRIDGTRNLLDASIAAGVRRIIGGSFAMAAPRGPVAADAAADPVSAAVRSMESQLLDASQRGVIDSVILRYGLFYGSDVPSTMAIIDMVRKRRVPTVRGDRGRLSLIHLDDAVSATMRALDSVPGVYDIVDDHPVSLSEMVQTLAAYSGAHPPLTVPAWLLRLLSPYIARMLAPRPAISNAAAKAVLGWRPAYPSLGDGLARMFPQAA
jgi:nucleoside-diphosphate-sugar epimerase